MCLATMPRNQLPTADTPWGQPLNGATRPPRIMKRPSPPFLTIRDLSYASGKVALCYWWGSFLLQLGALWLLWDPVLVGSAVPRWMTAAGLILGLGVPALTLLTALAHTLNRIELSWDGGDLVCRQGPVPWWDQRCFPLAAITGVYQSPELRPYSILADALWGNHRVILTLQGGKRATLLTGLPSAPEARLLAQMLELQVAKQKR